MFGLRKMGSYVMQTIFSITKDDYFVMKLQCHGVVGTRASGILNKICIDTIHERVCVQRTI